MPKVYLLYNSKKDYSQAEKFGELVVCTEKKINKFSVTELQELLLPILLKSSPDDYLIVSSFPLFQIVASNILMDLHERVNLLVFHKGEYELQTLHVTHEQDWEADEPYRDTRDFADYILYPEL